MLVKGKRIKSDCPTLGIVGLSAPDAVWFPDFYRKGIDELQQRGVKIVEGRTIHTAYFYLAERPEVVADGLHEMFLSEEVEAIMCAGGGIYMNKVLPFIDFELLYNNPKPFIGISNIVVLMVAMLQHNIVSFHGPFSIWSYGLKGTPTNFTHRNWLNILKGYQGRLPSVSQWKVFRQGEAQGALIGGNITSLGTVVGTPFCPPELFNEKLLILEEIEEDFGRLDSILTHMDLLGVFERINGVIIGKLQECSAPEKVDMVVEDFIDLIFGQYDFPVIYDCDFGHIPDNLCLPLGCRAKMVAQKEDPEIILLESGVV